MQTCTLYEREETCERGMLMRRQFVERKGQTLAQKGHGLLVVKQKLHNGLTAIGALTLIGILGFGTAGIIAAYRGNGALAAFALQSAQTARKM
jgi:hypothetical protein